MRCSELEIQPQAATRLLRQAEEEEEEKPESTGLLSRQGDSLAQLVTQPRSQPHSAAQIAALRHSIAGQPSGAANSLLRLQRTYGNRYTQRLIARVAKGSAVTEVAPEVEEAIQSARGGGQALDSGVRAQMEQAFGSDFGGVRVHTDAEADRLSRGLSARAFTMGQDVFFRERQYAPGSSSGRELLAHELTHVAQQTKGIRSSLVVSQPRDVLEREADEVAQAVIHFQHPSVCVQPACEQTSRNFEEDEQVSRTCSTEALVQRNSEEDKEEDKERTATERVQTTRIQRAIGDGHDLVSPRFSGDPVLEACYDNERVLQKGDQGPAVKKVQEALLDSGFPLPRFGADGKFGAETERAVIMFQKSAGLIGSEADGIIGTFTIGLLDQRIGGTPKDWAKHLKEGLSKLSSSGIGFPYTEWAYDSSTWEKAPDPQYAAYKPKSGFTPSQAIDKLFNNLSLWNIDCSMFPEVATLYAYRHSLGESEFNRRFSTLKLRQHETGGIKRDFYDVEDLGKTMFNRLWNNAPAGSKVMWTNKSSAADGTAWKHENAIKSFKGSSPGQDRYDAHPLGASLSERQVKRGLAENASDFPESGTKDQKKTYVRLNIYRHQLHLIKNPP